MVSTLTSPPTAAPPSAKPGPAPELPRHPLPGLRKATDLAVQIDRDLAKLGGVHTSERKEHVGRLSAALTALGHHLDQMVAHANAGYPCTYAD
ncbi:MAG TPA: hypothetical protein VGE52_12295 [Pirellulales bacterium]